MRARGVRACLRYTRKSESSVRTAWWSWSSAMRTTQASASDMAWSRYLRGRRRSSGTWSSILRAIRSAPFSIRRSKVSWATGKRARRCMASARTGSQTRSGASSSSMRATTQLWWRSARSRKATIGPVSAMAATIAAEVRQVPLIGGEVGDARIDHAARLLHELGEAGPARSRARGVEDQAQPLLDQVLELAAAQSRLRLGAAVEVVGHLDSGLHGTLPINPYSHTHVMWTRQHFTPTAKPEP